MKNFGNIIQKLNFKKIVKVYIVFVIIGAIFSGVFLGYKFRDKLLFVYNYNRVREKIENGKLGVNAVKSDITTLANKSSDIVDILILDKNNKVSFSAKHSEFAGGGEFTLERDKSEENLYLTYSKNPNVTFMLMKKNELMLSTVFLNHEWDIKDIHNDRTFFENDFNSKKVYLLSYAANRSTGDKIYFISDVHPVPNSSLYIEIVGALATLFFMLYWVLLALWVYQNAYKSKLNALLWGIITLFTNLAGLFIYLIYKQNNNTCFKCGAVQNKGNIYCTYCGTKISNTCKNCGAITDGDDSFCNQCGSRINNN